MRVSVFLFGEHSNSIPPPGRLCYLFNHHCSQVSPKPNNQAHVTIRNPQRVCVFTRGSHREEEYVQADIAGVLVLTWMSADSSRMRWAPMFTMPSASPATVASSSRTGSIAYVAYVNSAHAPVLMLRELHTNNNFISTRLFNFRVNSQRGATRHDAARTF